MDDGGGAGVEEVEATQDLPPPAPDHLVFNGFQTTHVAVGGGRGEGGRREGRGREKYYETPLTKPVIPLYSTFCTSVCIVDHTQVAAILIHKTISQSDVSN